MRARVDVRARAIAAWLAVRGQILVVEELALHRAVGHSAACARLAGVLAFFGQVRHKLAPRVAAFVGHCREDEVDLRLQRGLVALVRVAPGDPGHRRLARFLEVRWPWALDHLLPVERAPRLRRVPGRVDHRARRGHVATLQPLVPLAARGAPLLSLPVALQAHFPLAAGDGACPVPVQDRRLAHVALLARAHGDLRDGRAHPAALELVQLLRPDARAIGLVWLQV